MTDGAEPGQDDPRRIIAVRVGSLFLGQPMDLWTKADTHRADTAHDWQLLGAHATFSDIAGVNSGQPAGRMIEIVSRAAAAGEQLMLAGAALRDARRTQTLWATDLGSQVTSRALIEMANYFTLSAGHGLANITLRVLLMSETARAVLNVAHPKAAGFSPFSGVHDAWIALNPLEVRTMRRAAATADPAVQVLVAPLTALLGDAAWSALSDQRAIDFHRHRPQTVSGGAPIKNPWMFSGGTRSLAFGEFNDFEPPEVAPLYRDAERAAGALTTAMDQWLQQLPVTLNELLGTPVFKNT